MKRFTFTKRLILLGCIIAALCVAIPATAFAQSVSAKAASPMVKLYSGKPVHGVVPGPNGVSYTFTAVAGQHITLAITRPHVSPSGARLQMNVYNPSGGQDVNGVIITTSPTEIDFTPNSNQVGTTTVAITPYDSGATGSFTLTYATDVTGSLTSGVPVNGAIKFAGQHADYTFTAVTNKHVTLAITNPQVSPPGTRLQMNVYDSSGAQDANGVIITAYPTEIDFTPTADQAGLTTVVISPYDFETTGSFTLTYATDVTGSLKSGVAVNGDITIAGQHADYTFKAVVGKHVTLAITNPNVSPPGSRLQMNVYDSSGAQDANGVIVSTTPTEIDFTPTADEAGLTTVVISPYDFETTGSFTLTYAKDVTGKLTSGTAITVKIKYAGQHAVYTFTAVAGVPVTLAITNPHVSPSGNRLQMNVYDSSGAQDANGVVFSTSPAEIQFTPTPDQAGLTTVVISPYDFETTGSFTLTYTAG